MVAPRILVGPNAAPPFVGDAVRAGGGEVVGAEQAEAVVWTAATDVTGLADVLRRAPDSRWVQLPWAGVEAFARDGVFGDGRTWTCGKGVYAEFVAEHALALALAGLRGLTTYLPATSWGHQSGVSLVDGTATVVGGGGITEALLALLAPLRTQVTVVRRHADRPLAGATRTVGPDRLHEALGEADAVFLALALTPETTGLIGAAELAAMRPHAWLINVARGRHVVTDDLVAALAAATIGGAGLDVTDPEPLPDGHALWSEPHAIVTPHTANTLEMARAPLSARITENVRRFGAGLPLIGLVDPNLGY